MTSARRAAPAAPPAKRSMVQPLRTTRRARELHASGREPTMRRHPPRRARAPAKCGDLLCARRRSRSAAKRAPPLVAPRCYSRLSTGPRTLAVGRWKNRRRQARLLDDAAAAAPTAALDECRLHALVLAAAMSDPDPRPRRRHGTSPYVGAARVRDAGCRRAAISSPVCLPALRPAAVAASAAGCPCPPLVAPVHVNFRGGEVPSWTCLF